MSPNELLRGVLDAKERGRLRRARLPITEKAAMVAVLQRMGNEIRRSAGREERPEWPLDTTEPGGAAP